MFIRLSAREERLVLPASSIHQTALELIEHVKTFTLVYVILELQRFCRIALEYLRKTTLQCNERIEIGTQMQNVFRTVTIV